MRFLSVISLVLLSGSIAFAQKDKGHLPLKKHWNACWIGASNDSGNHYGVYYFRKTIDLPLKPHRFVVNVSADNRYKLFVNGILISAGPARSDNQNWNYQIIDLAAWLKPGKNSISAIVWNEADLRPEAQLSVRAGFILQGSSAGAELVNTDTTWKCMQDKAYSPLTGIGYQTYYVAGPGEIVDMNFSIKDGMGPDFNDGSWLNAATITKGQGSDTNISPWHLVPSPIPPMEMSIERIPVLRKAEGITVPSSFPSKTTPVIIPPNTTATFLLDQTSLTNAYITLNFSKGKGSAISLGYAESLFDKVSKYQTKKGNRNDVDGKYFAGRRDSILSDGDPGQTFTTLYWRTYRYIRLQIVTKGDPLTLDDIYGTFTGYPFKLNARFEGGNPEIQKFLQIGWHTARLDAMETYMDCPYYEQLQYIGDTRIQAMISYFNSGDERLAQNAINQIDRSRTAEGLTLSRYPSGTPQLISTFSLMYIGMLHDYWMYRPDAEFIKGKLSGERSVLNFFSKYQQQDGSLKGTPNWTFVDWAADGHWREGAPPTGSHGGSCILDLQLLMAYQMAADMESKIGDPNHAKIYNEKANQLKQTIQSKYWDARRSLYADTEDKNLYSQHANSLAILAGLVNPADELLLSKKILMDSSLTQCTIYFKYYMHQALVKSGLGNDYFNWLDIWRKNIASGLTTWAETSDLTTTRSDCHAWGASPNIEFYRTVLGIDSYAPGFKKIKIEPFLGKDWSGEISGEIPHPNGKVSVRYRQGTTHQYIKIILPPKTTGIFIWEGKRHSLYAGYNNFRYSKKPLTISPKSKT